MAMSKLKLHITIELQGDRPLRVDTPDGWEEARADLLRGLDAARAALGAQPLPMNPFTGPTWPKVPNPPGLAVGWRLESG
ncbi:MAG: hypothetical protein JWM53_964 [bacterium]|nr:hypothetical protein [bacterium]